MLRPSKIEMHPVLSSIVQTTIKNDRSRTIDHLIYLSEHGGI